MSSLELVDLINKIRVEEKPGSAELKHDNFLKKVVTVLGDGDAVKFYGIYLDAHKREKPCYYLPKRESMLMVMSESYKVQAAVYDRMEALEVKPQTLPKSSTDLAGAVEIFTRALNFSESAKVIAFTTLIPELKLIAPTYVIDKAATSVAGSSDVTHSLSHLLKLHEIPLSAIQANKLLHSSGILTQHSRKAAKGEDKKFWAFTEEGLSYGKNVTNPTNPRETQPLFFDVKFEELTKKFLA